MEKFSLEQPAAAAAAANYPTNYTLLAANCFILFLGSIASTILSRFYFIHGGSSRWLSTWVQSAGFPLLLLPIYLSPPPTPPAAAARPFSTFTPKLLSLCLLIGVFLGLNNFLFSWGISYLSISTSSLLLSSQLAFTLLLSAAIVHQKLHFSNVNSVVLLTLSSILLGLGSSHDRPRGVTNAQFSLGFFSILGASLLFALYLPVMERLYKSTVHTYRSVMEVQVVMEAAATLFSAVGIVVDGGFTEVVRESETGFDLGSGIYWGTVAATVFCWQMCFLGTAGLVFLTSSLNGGICVTALLSMNVAAGVVVFGDGFGGTKAVAVALCLWAFSTYLFGEYRREKKKSREVQQGKEIVPEDDGTILGF